MRAVFLILLLFLISPVQAVETYHLGEVEQYNVFAEDDTLITSVFLNDIKPNFCSQTIFDAYGEQYVFNIEGAKSWGYWTFDISLTYPNLTVANTTLKSFQPFASDTDIKVQYFYPEFDSVFDVDVFVGLLPLTASFVVPADVNSEIGKLGLPSGSYQRIAFNRVSGNCTQPVNMKVYFATREEFEAQRAESVKEMITGSTKLFVRWGWDAVLAFAGKIPGIGPYLITTLDVGATLVDSIFFYFRLIFVDYLETTLISIEFFILSDALISTKRGGINRLVNKIISNHVRVIEFSIDLLTRTISIVIETVRAIAAIVNAIKPL